MKKVPAITCASPGCHEGKGGRPKVFVPRYDWEIYCSSRCSSRERNARKRERERQKEATA